MSTIFTKIVNGEIPSYKIAEDERFYAFLDISPLKEGHTLVIPKRETDYIFDLEEDELSSLFVFARKVAVAIKGATSCKRVGMAVIGMEVSHAHIHLIPIDKESDMDFRQGRLSPGAERMAEIASVIASKIV